MKYARIVAVLLPIVLLLALESGCKKESPTEPTQDTENPVVQVTGGTFQMGSTTGSPLEMPIHQVTVGSFYIDKTETTYEKWTDVRNWGSTHGYADLPVGQNGYNPSGINNPVTMVSWYDIIKWCNARSEKYGLTPAYYTSNTLSTVYRTGRLDLAADAVKWTADGYRLPTEAEWEYAARGGTKSRGYKYSGSSNPDSVEWWVGNSDNNTHSVSTKGTNELGIFDMCGNVWEWCWDWYGSYGSSSQTDPKGPTSGTFRVIRGGSCWCGWMNSTSTYRENNSPDLPDNTVGFRCVRQ
jgi:sulfatase modifying factor 1